ncbi:DUF4148 domain-containing protein [Burkholderia sp. Bp9142]|uniref:DUF4148 domain-containing protein n=1 Tax=Burkholderia sp. Bp9142 TaxID=2184573 RepID=UPI000F59102F|nr:DUF4148 domain-containing protein [Burkholderia sp. Bp9142]RQR27587.1 DUF4148 domain-containing protein [Burkholderia sp. Bp9142]
MKCHIKEFALAAVAAAFLIGGAVPAFAQASASAPAATQDAKAAEKEAKRQAKKQARQEARAQRKAERKAARAKSGAELKRLEAAGYKPAANDPNYPEDLQNAEKKAGAAAGASR